MFKNLFNSKHEHGHEHEDGIRTTSQTHYENGVPVTVITTVKTINGVTTTTTTTTRGGKAPTQEELQEQLQKQLEEEQKKLDQGQRAPSHSHPHEIERQVNNLTLEERPPQPKYVQRNPARPLFHFSSHMQAEECHPDLHANRVVDGVKMPLHRLHGQDEEDIIDALEKRGIVVSKGHQAFEFSDRDFQAVDRHARETPQSETHTVEKLSKHLTGPFKNNELFQHRAIFTWIAENITYDTAAFLKRADTPQDPDTVLKNRICVCAGYSNLYFALAQVAGLKASVVHGFGRGYGTSPKDRDVERDSHTGKPTGHAWNSMEVKGNLYLLDATWGSGHLDGNGHFIRGFNPFYFAMKPKHAIFSHLPGDDENQFISPPLSVEEFLELPYVKGPYFRSKLRIISPKPRTGEIHTQDGIIDLYVEAEDIDDDENIIAHTIFDGHPVVDALSQRVGAFGKGRKVWWIHAICPGSGEGKLELFIVKGTEPGPNAMAYHVHNSGPGQKVNLTTRFASQLRYAVLHPLHHPKPVNTPIRVEIMVFDPQTAPDNLIVMRAGSHGEGRMNLPKTTVIDDEVVMYEEAFTFPQKGDWDIYYTDGADNRSLSGIAKITIS